MSVGAPVDPQAWEQLWLPRHPLASDDLRGGTYRTSRQNALQRRYIEANPEAVSNLLVVDIDHEDALMRALWDRHAWLPNAVVESPGTGRAHAVWALAEPVTRTEYAKRAPLAFAAAVTEGLRRSVDGDAGYSGLMTKNPCSQTWEASWWTNELYTLKGLANHLTDAGFMPPESWRRTRRKNPVGLGRNCALFETARHWAYREVRHHFGNPNGLINAIENTAQTMNQELFTEPLPVREVKQIAASISRWIITRSRIWEDGPATYEATFSTIQSTRGKKSGEKRRELQEKKVSEVPMSKSDRPQRLGVRRPGLTAREAAKRVGRSPRTIQRWTSEPRDVWLSRAEQRGEKIRELRAQGLSMRAIAAEVGCGVGTVHRHIHLINE